MTVAGDASRPTFLVIGAMRAGTTTLWHQLRSHPEVHMPALKEPGFFAAEHNWHRGLGWYQRLFENARGASAVGEASTCYSDAVNSPGVPQRLAKVLPDVRLIYLLRHPVDRLLSEHQWASSRGSIAT